jgi:prepilin-type N-terminal cleavage/methylation domain-containing protein
MKTYVHKRRGFTLVELLVVIVIIASLAGLTAPMVIRQRKKADQTEATSNARQIGLALFEFENDFGSFPGTSSLDTLTEVGGAYASSTVQGEAGTDSNGYFKQLIHAGLTQSEAMFYAKTPLSKKPDGDISTNDAALEDGEVGFGYITNGAGVGMSTSGNPSRAVVAAPLVEDGSEFDAEPYDKNAVILRIDNSASSVKIVPASADATTGPAIVGGVDLMSATNPIWGSTDPTMNPPLPK